MANIVQENKLNDMKELFKMCDLEYDDGLSRRRNGMRAVEKMIIQADKWERDFQLELNDKTKISLLQSCLWCKDMIIKFYKLSL